MLRKLFICKKMFYTTGDDMDDTIFIVGESRTNMDNAITIIYNSFYIAFEIDLKTGQILDCGCTHTIDLTEKFVKKLFIGRDIADFDTTENEIKKRYHGTSQKAIIVSYKDALKKFLDIKDKLYT